MLFILCVFFRKLSSTRQKMSYDLEDRFMKASFGTN